MSLQLHAKITQNQAYLVETNIVGVFTETLTTNVEVVLADQTSTVSTDTTR